MDKVLKALDVAAEAFHAVAGDLVPGRAEQFDSHMATIRMAVDLAADEVVKAALEAEKVQA